MSRHRTNALCLGGALLGAVVIAGSAGCLEREVAAEGEFGRRIQLLEDGIEIPRLAYMDESCPGTPAGCSAYCEDDPATCLENTPEACMPLLIDSGSPFSVLPSTSAGFAVERRCFEIRSAEGLPNAAGSANSVARFRFLDPPIVRAPGDTVDGWTWNAGSELASTRVGAVLGGSTLRSFAIELRNASDAPPAVAFFRDFPGDEAALADQGRAYLRLQFPGRLLGRQVDDKCEFGGVDCELDGIDITPDDEELVYESTRMLLDACVAPPPCAPLFETDPDDITAEPECRLRAGGEFRKDADGDVVGCVDATDEVRGGLPGTLLVATGIPDLVLFGNSAVRMFGDLDALPSCTQPVDLSARACRVDASAGGHDGKLFAPGWPPLNGLTRIRVRALGLVPGNLATSGPNPCERLRRRLLGLQQQCTDFAQAEQPWKPAASDEFEDARTAYGAAVLGEAHWVGDQQATDRTRWIDTLVVPETAPMVLALRRDVGSDALEPDGMIGDAMLQGTEVVLDYTESDERPGVRLTCLSPGGGECLSVPACHEAGGAAASPDAPEGSVGRISCCHGLPQSLLGRVIREGAGKDPPRVEDACCAALHPDALAQLQAEDAGLCAGVDPI